MTKGIIMREKPMDEISQSALLLFPLLKRFLTEIPETRRWHY
jgi:hypothetical protein